MVYLNLAVYLLMTRLFFLSVTLPVKLSCCLFLSSLVFAFLCWFKKLQLSCSFWQSQAAERPKKKLEKFCKELNEYRSKGRSEAERRRMLREAHP